MNILDIFYNNIIPEALNGRIDCFSYYNVIFSTNIVDEGILYEAVCSDERCIIPTLIIKNKELFDELLKEYVNLALDFYKDENFNEEILNYKMYDNKKRICKEKSIIALLFANATFDDFNDPISFLIKRINFIKNNIECDLSIGYCDAFKGNMHIQITKDIINNETPYQFIIKIINDLGEEFIFPRIKFGISYDKVYVYAIQNKKNNDSKYVKKVNRELYKIGIGFNFDNEINDEKLKDITASFLVSLNVFFSYIYALGFNDIVVPSLLIERWNAKCIANSLRASFKNFDEDKIIEINNEHELLQKNLTNKLIRTFLRLICHYNNLFVYSFPGDFDFSLYIGINDNSVECNNPLLDETYKIVENYFLNKNYQK